MDQEISQVLWCDDDDDMSWMYYPDYYLAIMYGLLLIEMECAKNNINDGNQLLAFKKNFIEKAKNYRQEHKIYYRQDDLDYLFGINMTYEYKDLIEDLLWDKIGDEEMNMMISFAKSMFKCNETQSEQNSYQRDLKKSQ